MTFTVFLKFMKNVFCFDIDGTLLDNGNKVIHESVKKTLRTLKKNGEMCIIATGRSFESVRSTGLLEVIDWDGLVLNNGQVVLDHEKKILSITTIDEKAAQELIDLCNKKGYNCSIETGKDWFMIKEVDKNTQRAHDFFHEIFPPTRPYRNEPIVMVMVYGDLDDDYQEFKDIQGLNVLPGVSSYADICAQGMDKVKGIQVLMNHLQVEEYIAFGDGENDIEMLTHSKMGIAMGQAKQCVKDAADFITLSCGDDGITYACQYLGYIKEVNHENNECTKLSKFK